MNAKQQFLLVGALPAGCGLLSLVASFNFDLPALVTPGLLALSLAAIGSGVASCAYRRVVFLDTRTRRFDLFVYHGIAAVPFGCTYLIGGLLVLAAAVAHLAGMSADAMRSAVLARPGLLLAPLGIAALSSALGFAIGFDDAKDPRRGSGWHLLMSIPALLGALILFAIGAALLGLGGWELLQPAAFDQWLTALRDGA